MGFVPHTVTFFFVNRCFIRAPYQLFLQGWAKAHHSLLVDWYPSFLLPNLLTERHNTRPLFNLNHLLSPILIIYVLCSNVLFGRLYIYGHPIPTNSISVFCYLFSIPILWFPFERLLKNHVFTSFPWVFGHIHFLTPVSVVFCYPYTKTLFFSISSGCGNNFFYRVSSSDYLHVTCWRYNL